jgi:hypothetical protein
VFCGGGNECYDELDHDTCEDGFVDRGFGCEREYPLVQPVCPPRCEGNEDIK